MDEMKVGSCLVVILLIFGLIFSTLGCIGDDEVLEMNILEVEQRPVDKNGIPPERGYVYLYLHVEMINLMDDRVLSLDPEDFELKTDIEGSYRYAEETRGSQNIPSNSEGDLWISFEMAYPEKGETLVYHIDDEDSKEKTIPTYSLKNFADIRVNKAEIREHDHEGEDPQEGYEFLWIEIETENLDRWNLPLQQPPLPSYPYVITDEGREHDITRDKGIPYELEAHSVKNFWAIVELPEDETAKTLVIEARWAPEPYVIDMPEYD